MRIITDFIDGSTTTRYKLFAKFALCVLKTTEYNRKKNTFCELLKASLLPHINPNETTTTSHYVKCMRAQEPKLDSSIFRFRIQQASLFLPHDCT